MRLPQMSRNISFIFLQLNFFFLKVIRWMLHNTLCCLCLIRHTIGGICRVDSSSGVPPTHNMRQSGCQVCAMLPHTSYIYLAYWNRTLLLPKPDMFQPLRLVCNLSYTQCFTLLHSGLTMCRLRATNWV